MIADNSNEEQACESCPPGSYSPAGSNVCRECAAGYLCLGGATTSTPNSEKEGGLAVPAGFYAPEGSNVAIACPAGTFRS